MRTLIEWHSVNEELPKADGLYLVVAKTDDSEQEVDVQYFFIRSRKFTVHGDNVTYWSNLPKLPEAGRD
jgi:hypothetical protein